MSMKQAYHRNKRKSQQWSLGLYPWSWKSAKGKWGIKGVASISNMREVSPPSCGLVCQLHRKCPERTFEFINSERPVGCCVSPIMSRLFPVHDRVPGEHTPWCTLWLYLHDHGEDMKKVGGKMHFSPICVSLELQGNSFCKNASLVSSGKLPRTCRRTGTAEGTTKASSQDANDSGQN